MTKDILYSKLPDNTFSRTFIFETATKIEPAFKKTQMTFYINQLIENNMIVRTGYGTYIKNKDKKPFFSYTPSAEVSRITDFLENNYPLVKFCIWDISILNEFINHMIAHNHIFLEVEKDGAGFIYEALKENFKNSILFQPTVKEMERYSTDNDILIENTVSEAPETDAARSHQLCLEKLIVDMFANKLFMQFISKGDYPQALEEMFGKYQINEKKLFRYAARRNKKEEIIAFIKDMTNIKLQTV